MGIRLDRNGGFVPLYYDNTRSKLEGQVLIGNRYIKIKIDLMNYRHLNGDLILPCDLHLMPFLFSPSRVSAEEIYRICLLHDSGKGSVFIGQVKFNRQSYRLVINVKLNNYDSFVNIKISPLHCTDKVADKAKGELVRV